MLLIFVSATYSRFMKKDPHILAKEIQQGDVASFEVFYKAEFDNLVFFIKGYLRDEFRAEDIAQESLTALWNKREMIDPDKNIRALVFTIARNRTINEIKSRTLFANSIEINEMKANIIALSDDSLDAEINALSLKELIERTMANLPDSVRSSFVMSRKMGMTNKEIAKAKNMSLTGIEYHMKISLKIFREKLKEYAAYWGCILFFLYYD